MPELPEVETIVRGMGPALKGRRFLTVESERVNTLMPVISAFEGLIGGIVREVSRRGKFINIFLDNDGVITLHLRMSGRVIVSEPASAALPYERARLDFTGVSLRFCDPRRFGRIWAARGKDYQKITGIERLGVEPLEKDFDTDTFIQMGRKRKGLLKAFLLDQRFVAGIGNIYADEACFYAGVRPNRRLERLKAGELAALHGGIVRALKQGVKNRGTSISDFEDAYGRRGKNQELLYVYGRGGLPCLTCRTPLTKTRIAGRGTVFCTNCQK